MLFKEGKKHTVLKLTGATIQETVNPFITAITLNCITILHINHLTGAALPFSQKTKKNTVSIIFLQVAVYSLCLSLSASWL